MRNTLYALLFLVFCRIGSIWGAARGRTVATYVSRDDDESNAVQGTQPDPFVTVAPLIAAVVCADGIVLVATYGEEDEEGVEEMLLYGNSTDWQEDYHGVPRIHKIDRFGSALVCAGWRTDGEWLARQCRYIAANEIETMGPIVSTRGYPIVLAHEASLWMAKCAASDGVRSLSTVGLLACCCGKDDHDAPCLYLVDATGYYPVGAQAVGKGAAWINQGLFSIDWRQLNTTTALNQLLDLLRDPLPLTDTNATKDGTESDPPTKESASSSSSEWHLSGTTRVEVAILEASTQKLQRIHRIPFLVT